MNKKATDIVSYLTLIGWLIAYFAGDRENCKFHLNQGLLLAICELALSLISAVFAWIPILGTIISFAVSVCGIVLFVFWIIALIGAINGEEKPLPVIGGIHLLK